VNARIKSGHDEPGVRAGGSDDSAGGQRDPADLLPAERLDPQESANIVMIA
jgi:hypothetical protein